jgi:D-glycero-beta-D-manno-heptose 1-phosphate adenylyltransferase
MAKSSATPPSPQSNRGILGAAGSSADERYIADYKRLAEVVEAFRTVGLKIVLTMGTFDLIHVGHFLYLEKAKSHGDVLVVGVDSDEKVRARKGPDRPVVSEDERVRMLTHVRHVDVVTLKPATAKKWELIKLIRPDVLVATKETYDADQIKALREYCGEVVVLQPQATTSTTAKLRRLNIGLANKMKVAVAEAVVAAFDKLEQDSK